MGKEKDLCLGCSKSLKGKESHQCTVCGLWSHKTCSGVSDEFYKYLEEQQKATGSAYWACKPCIAYSQSITRKMREIETKVDKLSEDIQEVKTDNTRVDQRVEKLEKVVKKTEEKITDTVRSTTDDVFSEIRERETRKLNVLIHGMPESTEEVTQRRKEWDIQSCCNVFTALRLNLGEEAIKFCRRVGQKGEAARPLVLGFYTEQDKLMLIRNARKIQDTVFSEVTIAQDLTPRQREEESNLHTKAEELNAERNEDEVAKNLVWMVVGAKGEKRLVKQIPREQSGREQQRRGGLRGRPPLRGGAVRGRVATATATATRGMLPVAGRRTSGWLPAVTNPNLEPVQTSQAYNQERMEEVFHSVEEEEGEEEEEETETVNGTRKRRLGSQAGGPVEKRH